VAAAEPLLRFAQINDLHMPGPALEAVDEPARERGERARWLVNLLHGESSSSESSLPPLDLILGVGDFVQGNDAESASTELDLFASMIKARQVPFYPVVGNHDYGAGNAEAEQRFLEACGQSAPSYSFEHGDIAFIMLDNRPLSSLELNSQRTEWLHTTLEHHGAMPTIICCHIPLVPLRDQRSMDQAGVEGSSPGVAEMLKVVEDHSDRVLAVLSGHLHLSGFRCTRSIFHICIAGTATFPCDFALYSVYTDRIEVEVRQLPLDLLPDPAHSGYSSEKLGADLVDGDHATNIEFIMGTYDERRFVISMK
jgi:3',5'-cyclic AMP phosphodiesterase CpdA